MHKTSDVLIIGGGPAGLTAALYASRGGMGTIVIDKGQPGGQLWWSEKIENYPGFPDGIGSAELAARMEKQAGRFGAEFETGEVNKVEQDGQIFKARTAEGKIFFSDSLIITTGASMKKIGVKGEEKYIGRGVSYCAVCDGPLYKDRVVGVIGGGNTACEEAVYLTKFAKKVYLIHRRPRLRAVDNLVNRVEQNKKIQLVLESEVKEIKGEKLVKSLLLDDDREIKVDGIFIFIGLSPNTGFVKGLVKLKKGFIKTDKNMMTSVKGIFSAGDCRQGSLRQVVSGCGEGAIAGEQARMYVEEKKGISYDW
ncbi:MAG: thioredoxin-disulfide reductase [Elusimicrobiota bacterium]